MVTILQLQKKQELLPAILLSLRLGRMGQTRHSIAVYAGTANLLMLLLRARDPAHIHLNPCLGLKPMAGIGPTLTCGRSFLGSIFDAVYGRFFFVCQFQVIAQGATESGGQK